MAGRTRAYSSSLCESHPKAPKNQTIVWFFNYFVSDKIFFDLGEIWKKCFDRDVGCRQSSARLIGITRNHRLKPPRVNLKFKNKTILNLKPQQNIENANFSENLDGGSGALQFGERARRSRRWSLPLLTNQCQPQIWKTHTKLNENPKTKKANSTLRASRAVPHPSTDRAFRRLTSEFGWDRVHSTKYGRWRNELSPHRLTTKLASRDTHSKRWNRNRTVPKKWDCANASPLEEPWAKTATVNAQSSLNRINPTMTFETECQNKNTKSQQHPKGFPGGPPPQYWPGLSPLNFRVRMGSGVFDEVWPLAKTSATPIRRQTNPNAAKKQSSAVTIRTEHGSCYELICLFIEETLPQRVCHTRRECNASEATSETGHGQATWTPLPEKNWCDRKADSCQRISCHTDKNRYYTWS